MSRLPDKYAAQLPATEHTLHRAIPIATPLAILAEGKFVIPAGLKNVSTIEIRRRVIQLPIVVVKRSAGSAERRTSKHNCRERRVERPGVHGFGPCVIRLYGESVAEIPVDLRLQRVVARYVVAVQHIESVGELRVERRKRARLPLKLAMEPPKPRYAAQLSARSRRPSRC